MTTNEFWKYPAIIKYSFLDKQSYQKAFAGNVLGTRIIIILYFIYYIDTYNWFNFNYPWAMGLFLDVHISELEKLIIHVCSGNV